MDPADETSMRAATKRKLVDDYAHCDHKAEMDPEDETSMRRSTESDDVELEALTADIEDDDFGQKRIRVRSTSPCISPPEDPPTPVDDTLHHSPVTLTRDAETSAGNATDGGTSCRLDGTNEPYPFFNSDSSRIEHHFRASAMLVPGDAAMLVPGDAAGPHRIAR